MIITYGGLESIKIQYGDKILAFNPISKDSSLKPAKYGADIVLSTLNHPDTNGIDQVTFGEKKPFVISGPGEYETKGVFVKGFQSKTLYGKTEKINTVYTVILEGMTLCFLGALADEKLSPEFMEAIEDIDVLFLPIGGEGVLDVAKANKLAVTLEPKIIIGKLLILYKRNH
jgi:L-ascorbate metabolism protein UlaG (beta-lactamase superfamily)